MAANMPSSPPPDADASDPEPANEGGAAPSPALTSKQNALVKLGLPEVRRCAAEVARRYRGRFTPEEMLAPGTVGLLVAARSYDEERGLGFRYYARHYILGRMLNAIKTDLFSTRARVEHAMERAFCGFSAHQVLEGDLFADSEEKLLDDARRGCDDALAASLVAAAAEAREASPEDAVILRISLREALATLYPHELEVTQLVHEKGMSVAEASRDLRVHINTAQNRYTSALRKLRAFLLDGDEPPQR